MGAQGALPSPLSDRQLARLSLFSWPHCWTALLDCKFFFCCLKTGFLLVILFT